MIICGGSSSSSSPQPRGLRGLSISSLLTVSYTHLDVYKRQELYLTYFIEHYAMSVSDVVLVPFFVNFTSSVSNVCNMYCIV